MSLFKKIKRYFKAKSNFRLLQKQINDPAIKVILVHQKDTNNIGDLMCAPYLYFPELKQSSLVVSILNFEHPIDCDGKTIIVGGGGLFQAYFHKAIQRILELSRKNTVIFWGCGLDNRVGVNVSLPSLDKTICGIRDYGISGTTYVPCASCMSSLFDKYINTTNKHPYKLYLHTDYSKPILEDLSYLPNMINTGQDLDTVLRFLSDAEVVLTNSFHGIYWATLLGKKVIALPWFDKRSGKIGFSTKFHTLKYLPTFCENWNEYTEKSLEAKAYPHALQDARQANREFYVRFVEPIIKAF